VKFSIVIPVYQTEQYLPRCLDSLVSQTDPDFEVIVVDDCSPESAPCRAEAIVKRYDARFKCVRHERNRGAFQARCTGVAEAKGGYIVPLDPDDYLLPETLAKVCAVIGREAPDVVTYWIDCEDGRKRWPHWCRHPAATTSAVEMLREMAERKAMYSIVSKVVRREVYRKAVTALGLPDAYVNTAEDFLVTLAILFCCDRVSHLDYAGYRYFSNPTSITGTRRSHEGFRRACEQVRLVHDAVRAMALRTAASPEVQTYVDDIIALSERYFCTEVMEGPADQMQELAKILFKYFRPGVVGSAFVDGYAEIRESHAYRLGGKLTRFIRF